MQTIAGKPMPLSSILLRRIAVLALLAAAGWGIYRLGVQHGLQRAAPAAAPAALSDPSTWTIAEGEAATRRHLESGLRAGSVDPLTGRKVLYYHDPMVPGNRFDAPGKSPFMDMMLVPAYAGGEGADPGTVSISSRMQQNLGLRTAAVSAAGNPPVLRVPSEALMPTGRRTLVIVAEGGGHFRPVQVETGSEADGQTEILRGLEAGLQVVVSGQFLIDSEASLRGVEARMLPTAPQAHRTTATVEALAGDKATLTHPAVPSIKWPAMTMEFALPPAAQRPPDLAVGDQLEIEFRLQDAGEPLVTSMRRLAAGKKP
jgi:membrane fusion protein, copper/silver efflux system